MKLTNATIVDVKNALAVLEAAAAKDPTLEAKVGKKLAVAVDHIYPKDNVEKDLKQAYTNGEKWHALNAKKKQHGCTYENEVEKIKDYVLKTDAYSRHFGNPETRAKVESWIAEYFPFNSVSSSDQREAA